MHKQNFATQPRDWLTTSDEAWRFNKNLHATERPSTAPNGRNEPLHLGSSSANADDPTILEADVNSNHSEMASGCQSLVQPDVLGSLSSTSDAAVSGGGGTKYGTSDNGDSVSSVMSPGSPYTTVTVRCGCAVGKRRGWLMPAPSLMMEIVARQSWYGCNPPWGEEWARRGGWSHEPASVHPDPEESNVAMGDGVFTSNTMPRPILHVA